MSGAEMFQVVGLLIALGFVVLVGTELSTRLRDQVDAAIR